MYIQKYGYLYRICMLINWTEAMHKYLLMTVSLQWWCRVVTVF